MGTGSSLEVMKYFETGEVILVQHRDVLNAHDYSLFNG